MYSLAFVVVVSIAAVNAGITPAFTTSSVSSQRDGNNFAYEIHDEQAYVDPTNTMIAKTVARALRGPMPAVYAPGTYIAPGMTHHMGQYVAYNAAPAMHHAYAPHPIIPHHGVTAYAAQPVAYSGQPIHMIPQDPMAAVQPHSVVSQVKA